MRLALEREHLKLRDLTINIPIYRITSNRQRVEMLAQLIAQLLTHFAK